MLHQPRLPALPVAPFGLTWSGPDERGDWPGAETSPALLLNRRGRRLSARGASDIIRAIAAEANLEEEHITAHVGRHTFATTLIRGGTDLIAVADMLGHARLDTVRRGPGSPGEISNGYP